MDKNPWWRALLVLLVIIAGLYPAGHLWNLAVQFAETILLLFLACLLAFVLSPVAKLGSRYHLPYAAPVSLVYVGLLVIFIVAGMLAIPPVTDQMAQLGTN